MLRVDGDGWTIVVALVVLSAGAATVSSRDSGEGNASTLDRSTDIDPIDGPDANATSERAASEADHRDRNGPRDAGTNGSRDSAPSPGSTGTPGPAIRPDFPPVPRTQTATTATLTASSTTALGEAGRQPSLDDGEWLSEPLTSSLYGSTPRIFATTQTANGGQDPSQAHLRSVSASGFETQHCELGSTSDLTEDECDSHTAETNGWIALDPASVDGLPGMETGTFSIEDDDYETVSFTENFNGTPYVFLQVQTNAGAQRALNVQLARVTPQEFTAEFCEQDTGDGCDTHHAENTVAWWAIDPRKAEKGDVFDWGAVPTRDDAWTPISFDFASTPVVLTMVQSEVGVKEALYSEAKGVSSTGASVRYCDYEMNDACDPHPWETMAWVAVETGQIDHEGAAAVIAQQDGNITSGGSSTDTGILKHFSTKGSAPLEITYKYCYIGDTNERTAYIHTNIDGGATEHSFGFTTPYTGGTGSDKCTKDDQTTYGAQVFTLDQGVSNDIWFNYTNGDWRLAIADLSVNAGGGSSDIDEDGLQDREENVNQSTDPFDADTDDDELTDLMESESFPTREIFCAGSTCGSEEPDPRAPDAYLEVDGWEDCDSTGACDSHTMSNSIRDFLENTYADRDITLHIDNGNGALRDGGDLISDLSEDFDHHGAHAWSLGGLWHVSDDCERPPSRPYHLAFNQDSTCTYDTGGTPSGSARFSVDLNTSHSATLTFDHKWETESTSSFSADRMFVEVSTDGGASWAELDSWDSTDPNQATWTQASYDLSPYTSNIVDLRFRFNAVDDVSNDHPGWFIDDVVVSFEKSSISWENLRSQYKFNPNYFDTGRKGIVHQMIWVHYLDGGACGIARTPGSFSSLANQKFRDGLCDADSGPALRDTTLEEFGHNDFGTIEPSDDWCNDSDPEDDETIHDEYSTYAIECGVQADTADFHANRWTEYTQAVTTDDPDFPMGGDSNPGDLGNGIKGD